MSENSYRPMVCFSVGSPSLTPLFSFQVAAESCLTTFFVSAPPYCAVTSRSSPRFTFTGSHWLSMMCRRLSHEAAPS